MSGVSSLGDLTSKRAKETWSLAMLAVLMVEMMIPLEEPTPKRKEELAKVVTLFGPTLFVLLLLFVFVGRRVEILLILCAVFVHVGMLEWLGEGTQAPFFQSAARAVAKFQHHVEDYDDE